MTTALLAQVGAFRNWNAGELMTYVEFNEEQFLAVGMLLHVLGRMCVEDAADTPASGFVGDDLLPAKGTGDLDWTVEAGLGFQYVSASSGVWEHGYQPVLRPTQVTGTLSAHDATHPRIDLIVAKAATTTDSAENRSVKDVGTGAVAIQSVNTRRVYLADVIVVEGTPATPAVAPAVPAGYMQIASIAVPATSGPITVTDTRPRLALGQSWSPTPAPSYAWPHVVGGADTWGGATSLVVSAGAALSVDVERGEMWLEGHIYRHNAKTVALSTADPTHPRIDLIVCDRLTGPAVITGTPAASPSGDYGSVDQSNEVVLAEVTVAATATTVSSGDIADQRETEHLYGELHLQDRASLVKHLRRPPVMVNFEAGASLAAMTWTIPIKAVDSDGASLTAPGIRGLGDAERRLLVTVLDEGYVRDTGPTLAVTSGTSVSLTGSSTALVLDTNDDGTAEITFGSGSTGTWILKIEPYDDGPGSHHGYPVYKSFTI